MNRRTSLLMLGTGALAAGVGVAINWWRTEPSRGARHSRLPNGVGGRWW
jgi:hypothetical protein